jgi:NADH:ubiquinone oxidoreductase subunit 6 (subunit J)
VRTARTVPSAPGLLLLLAAAGIPWRSNQLTNKQDSLWAITEDSAVPLALYGATLVLCLSAVGAAFLLSWRWPALGAALLAAAAIVTAAMAVPLRTVRAIGVNAAGNTVEPEASDALATGYWLAVGAVVAVLLATVLCAFGSGRD